MNAGVSFSVMGPLVIRYAGQEMALPAKSQALLVYLAMTGRRARREVLADMFWGDTGEDGARANLRLALTKLRQSMPGTVEADADSVGLSPEAMQDVDARQLLHVVDTVLQQPLAEQEAAMSRYRGPFLQDFTLRECASFEDWVAAERQRIDRRAVLLLRELVQAARRALKPADEIRHLKRWAQIEPWNEDVQQPLIRLLAQNGATAAALDSFETCRRSLAEELGVRPSVALALLAEQVRRGELAAPAPQAVAPAQPEASLAPPVEKPLLLLGREADLQAIDAHIARGERLVMLLGPAGVGKSCLAMAVARRHRAQFPDGQISCSFDFLEQGAGDDTGRDHFVSVLATALGLDLVLTSRPLAMLKAHLATRRVILQLDGFEACIQATPLLVDLLHAAPECLFLVTSRTRLAVTHGWAHELRGLGSTRHVGRDPALALLLDCAARNGLAPESLTEHDMLLRLVKLLDGSPLAIQFAAQSLRVLSAKQLVHKLEQGDWPDSSLYVPGYRYNTLQDVMADMWSQLSAQLQDAWARCAQFKGAFALEWAHDCAGVSDLQVVQLMEHSILSRESSGHLRMHELPRQYGLLMLEQMPDAQSHREIFARAALDRLVALSDQLQREDKAAVDELHSEIATLASAFDMALQWASPGEIHPPLQALQRVYHRLGWHHAASRLIDAVLERHAEAPPAWRMVWHHMAGEIIHNQYGFQEEIAHYRTVVDLAGIVLPSAEARARLWGVMKLAQALFARPAAQAEERQAQRALTNCLLSLIVPQYMFGAPTSLLASYLCAAILAARRSGHAEAHMLAWLHVGTLDAVRARPKLQAALFRRARMCLRSLGPVSEAVLLRHQTISLIARGQWEEAKTQIQRAAHMFAALGNGYDALECQGFHTSILLHTGDFHRLLAQSQHLENEARRIVQPSMLRWSLLFKMQAWLRTGQGHLAGAIECVQTIHTIPIRRTRLEEVRILAHEALVLAAQGDVAGTLQRADEILPMMRQMSGGRFLLMAPFAVITDAVLHLAMTPGTGSPAVLARARQLVERYVRMTRGMATFVPRSALYQGTLAALQDDLPAAMRHWFQGVRARGAEDLPYDLARLHWMMSLHTAEGPESAEHAREAGILFDRCGVLGPDYPFMPSVPLNGSSSRSHQAAG